MLLNERPLAERFSRHWWLLLLRGLAAIIFGVLTWMQPGISLATLVLLFGVFAIADGILNIWTAAAGRSQDSHRWLLLLAGLVGILVGFLTFAAPGITALVLLVYIAVWAIVTGVLQVIAAVRLRKEVEGEWVYILGGVVSILFGALLLARPGTGALAVLWVIAFYAVFYGILMIIVAFKARNFGKRYSHT